MSSCRLCHAEARVVRSVEDRVRSRPGGFELVRCTDCEVFSVEPALTDEELAAYYDDEFYGRPSVASRLALSLFMAERRALLRRAGVTGGRLLDIGCGAGQFLSTMARAGFECVGMEPSPAGRARAAAHGTVVASVAAVPAGPYDCITLWQSLEHSSDPLQLLLDLHPLLAPDGALIVAVPNAGSAEARLFGERWFHLDVPRHQVHFTADGLRRLLSRSGFSTREIVHRSLEYGPFGLLQSVENVLPGERNALYGLVKAGRPLRSYDAVSRAKLALSVATLPMTTALATAVEAGLSAVGRAGTMTAIASPAMIAP